MAQRNIFLNIAPIDYRYWDERIAQFLSEEGFIGAKLGVELALVKVLHERGLCPESIVNEIERAITDISADEVYAEEHRVHHDILALANCIKRRVSDEAKPFVHMTATSFDISDTANAWRYQQVIRYVLIPSLKKLEEVLIEITMREAETLQVGRTHGQHAVPITFGFTIASYVSRLGQSIVKLEECAQGIRGKFTGAVGAYNASALFFEDPEAFEAQVLEKLGLKPAEVSTQIVPPESLFRLMNEIMIAGGIMADLADDMRHLQRTEIGEVGESFQKVQVGSSTMPQKRNPINFENVKSLWKILVGRMITVTLDQLSEHQRDLTNSASARTYPEIIAYCHSMSKRLTGVMSKLQVDHDNLRRNFAMQKDMILAEPLYILLAAKGHPDAHEVVRQCTLEAQKTSQPLMDIAKTKADLAPYLEALTDAQGLILQHPEHYVGIASKKAFDVALQWKQRFNI